MIAPHQIEAWLKSQVRPLIARAEERFGARDYHWAIDDNVSFTSHGPNTRLSYQPTCIVSIELHEGCRFFPDQAMFQLAHEVVHTLAPCLPPALMIEEASATEFSISEPSYFGPNYRQEARAHTLNTPGSENYRDALLLFEEFSAIYPDAIRQLRQREPYFVRFTPELIREVLPRIPIDLAKRACERRKMR